uniref:ISXO2-like transposase domain-containing protein n=1 Tax=Octopus bimaculoides TaxID=37653 RepID=A0A0L8FX66_OCTBM
MKRQSLSPTECKEKCSVDRINWNPRRHGLPPTTNGKKSNENFVNYLKENQLIANQKQYTRGNDMDIRPSQRATNGMEWRCRNCRKRVSIRKNTFVEKSKLSVYQILHIIFDIIFEMPVTSSMCPNNVSKVTAIQWYEHCREICSQKLLKDKKKLGGPNHVVKVDESLMFRRKNEVGRVVQLFWVVGFYDNIQKKRLFATLQDRKAETLEALIIENIEPGSIILTDQWAG